jgi:hypothetical protein
MRVSKTGSTSIQSFLIEKRDPVDKVAYTRIPFLGIDSLGFPNTVYPHLNLSEALEIGMLKESDLKDFRIYGIIRDPIDRFISRAYHYHYYNNLGTDIINPDAKNYDKNLVVRYTLPKIKINERPWEAQSNWLLYNKTMINKIFTFNKINFMLNDMTGIENPILNHFRSDARQDKSYNGLDKNLINEIKEIYHEDVEIYEKINDLSL